jgi:hypothetical protein
MEFAVKCPHCDSRLKASQDLMGVSVECGYCFKELRVPEFEVPKAEPELDDSDEEARGKALPAWLIPAVVLLGMSGLTWLTFRSSDEDSAQKVADAPPMSAPVETEAPATPDSVPVASTPATASTSPATTAADKPEDEPPKRSSAETLEYLKAATVFVKVTTTAGEQSGSGFLIEHTPEGGHVVTNAHVVDPAEGRLMSVECVFIQWPTE